MNKKLSLWLVGALLASTQLSGQQPNEAEPWKFYSFSQDSLAGFDEQAASASAISLGFLGDEYPVRMYQLKREFIDNKYDLIKPQSRQYQYSSEVSGAKVVAGCVNEDFEASSAGQITASNQIMGWTVTSGTNSGTGGGNSCNLLGCCPAAPKSSALIDAANGYTDPIIKNCYKIYSVFGDGPGNAAAAAENPHIPFPMRGSKFIRINNEITGDRSIERLSKTFSVTPNNALFQFAFLAVFAPEHDCCTAGAFKISLPGMTCPTFSASAPSCACQATNTGISYSVIPNTSSSCSTLTPCSPFSLNCVNPNYCTQYIYSKWQISSMDLTAYIGQTVTIEVVASDCTAGGHFGYVYFDAQCGPMSVLGNGVPFPAGDTNVVIPTCGPSGATICATPGLGPYKWEGPNIPPGYASFSYTNQCFTTSVSATYTLYMNPPGGCAPFSRIVHTTVTPAPTMIGNVVQATCGGTLAVATVTTGGSAGNPAYIEWYPPPMGISGNSTQATYTIPAVGQPTQVITVTAADQIGCPITITLGINPPAPIPTFTVQNTTGTSQLTCFTPSISLAVNTTYTYGTASFFWSSPSFTSTSQNITVTTPGSYTVSLTDPVTQCAKTETLTITQNTVMPNSQITPTFQTITCASGSTIITLTALSPTINFEHVILSPLGGSFVANSTQAQYQAGTPGTYTHYLVNLNNGCRTTKQFTVSSTDGFPIFSLTSARNFTIGCFNRNWADINIQSAQATPSVAGSVSYSLLLPGGSTVVPPTGTLGTQAAYTVTIPGSYTVVTRNNANNCDTKIPVSILTNTLAPSIDSIVMPTTVLSCFTPSTLIKGISNTPNVAYRWILPNSTSQSGDQYISQANFSNRTETVLATYTFEVTDQSSECINTQTVTMLQNLFLPIADISGETSLSCDQPTVLLSNNSNPDPANPHPTGQPVVAYLWEGPTPSVPQANSSSYLAYYPGTFTMYVRDMNNGCVSTATANLPDNFIYPVLNNPTDPGPFFLGCGADSAHVYVNITNTVSTPEIVWSAVNLGNKPFTYYGQNVDVVDFYPHNTGIYAVNVTEPTSGCVSETTVAVLADTIAVGFTADKTQGYAPLTVTFENTSRTESANSNIPIQSVWVFGNSQVADTLAKVLTTTYTQPGQYTVALYANKGACLDTAFMVITVDIPSELVIPNVFSPNGDGVNDIFRLQRSSNLTQVKFTIYDRWGNLTYEVDSATGQIAWDGKNQYGKDAPAGTYFYIMTASGRDGKTWDQKGTLTLVR